MTRKGGGTFKRKNPKSSIFLKKKPDPNKFDAEKNESISRKEKRLIEDLNMERKEKNNFHPFFFLDSLKVTNPLRSINPSPGVGLGFGIGFRLGEKFRLFLWRHHIQPKATISLLTKPCGN